MKPDLTYRTSGLFTTFFAESKPGEDAWRTLAEQTNGTGKIFTIHLKSMLQQLRAAGYKVSKVKASPFTMEEIFSQLDALDSLTESRE